MKQGTGNSAQGAHKTEPKSQAVNPEGVAQIGLATAFPKKPVYEGRGIQAPMAGESSHKSGSQGKY